MNDFPWTPQHVEVVGSSVDEAQTEPATEEVVPDSGDQDTPAPEEQEVVVDKPAAKKAKGSKAKKAAKR